MKTFFKITLSVIVLMMSLVSCVSKNYNPEISESPDAPRERLYQIESEMAELRGNAGYERLRSNYRMEQGMIYEMVLHQDQDSIDFYRKAIKEDPSNCDAQILLASVLSRKVRSERAVNESGDVLSDMIHCGNGTLLLFNRAKWSILSDSSDDAQGREYLEELSTLNLGESGVKRSEIFNLLLYSHLKEGDFNTASQKMEPDVELMPELEALMYIGGMEFDRLSKFKNQPEALDFISEGEPSDYLEEIELEKLISENIDTVEAVMPEVKYDDSITSVENTINRINLQGDVKLLKIYLEDRKNKLAEIRQNMNELRISRAQLLDSELRHFLTGKEKSENTYQNHVIAYQNLKRSTLELGEVLQDVLSVGEPHMLLDNPEMITQDAQFLEQFLAREDKEASEENIIRNLFTNFAVKKSRALKFHDFFEPFTVSLKDLDYSSRDVRKSVERLLEVTGQKFTRIEG
jgi:hypothetical protein